VELGNISQVMVTHIPQALKIGGKQYPQETACGPFQQF